MLLSWWAIELARLACSYCYVEEWADQGGWAGCSEWGSDQRADLEVACVHGRVAAECTGKEDGWRVGGDSGDFGGLPRISPLCGGDCEYWVCWQQAKHWHSGKHLAAGELSQVRLEVFD